MTIRLHLFSKNNFKKLVYRVKKFSNLKILFQSPLFWIFFSIFSFLPLIFYFSFSRFSQLADSKKNFQEIKCRTEKLSKTLKHRTEFLMAYEKANPQFLNHSLEKIVFLKPEIETLRVIYGHPAFQSCPAVKERLSRLTKGENCLVFSEKKRDTSSLLEEFYYHQEVPVEVNGEDIKQILSMIEGIKIGVYQPPFDRPQLVIQYFDLKRDELFGRECYFLEMNLIKRQPMIRG